jgi:hypothetical protein
MAVPALRSPDRPRLPGRVNGASGVARDAHAMAQAPPLTRPTSRTVRQLRRASTSLGRTRKSKRLAQHVVIPRGS